MVPIKCEGAWLEPNGKVNEPGTIHYKQISTVWDARFVGLQP